MLADCSVAASRGGDANQAVFYAALETSLLRASCTELVETTSTMFVRRKRYRMRHMDISCPFSMDFSRLMGTCGYFQATVQVEFRAPSSLVAERLAEQHQMLVTGLTQLYSAPGCTGRRSLEEPVAPTAESEEMTDLREQLRQANEKLVQSDLAVAELSRAVAVCEADKNHTVDEEPVEMPPPQQRRQVQALTESPEFARVALPSGEIRACAVLPCELAGACLNGGECVPGDVGLGNESLAADFTCRCVAGFAGPQCADVVAVTGGDPCGAGAVITVPADGGGTGSLMQIVYEPAGGYPSDADCSWLIECPATPGAQAELQFVLFDTEVRALDPRAVPCSTLCCPPVFH